MIRFTNIMEGSPSPPLPTTVCSICGCNRLVTVLDSGELVCSSCGAVISDKLLEIGPEWRNFDQGEKNSTNRARTGMPTSLARSDMGLSTVISYEDKDASRNKIEPSMLSTMHRLRVWDFRTQVYTSTDRNLRFAFNELDTLKGKLGLPNAVIEKAAYIYRKGQEKGLVRGRTIPAVLAAALYIACKQMGIPRTLNDISTTSNIKRKSISKCYRRLIFDLDLKLPVIDTRKCIASVANKANVSERTKYHAIKIMNEVIRARKSAGKDPMGLAATVLYASCIRTGEQKSQIDLAKAADVTEVTIRNRLKDLQESEL
jgi:transcription initiation factor TFIIB